MIDTDAVGRDCRAARPEGVGRPAEPPERNGATHTQPSGAFEPPYALPPPLCVLCGKAEGKGQWCLCPACRAGLVDRQRRLLAGMAPHYCLACQTPLRPHGQGRVYCAGAPGGFRAAPGGLTGMIVNPMGLPPESRIPRGFWPHADANPEKVWWEVLTDRRESARMPAVVGSTGH